VVVASLQFHDIQEVTPSSLGVRSIQYNFNSWKVQPIRSVQVQSRKVVFHVLKKYHGSSAALIREEHINYSIQFSYASEGSTIERDSRNFICAKNAVQKIYSVGEPDSEQFSCTGVDSSELQPLEV
jgi:hypothetical protein